MRNFLGDSTGEKEKVLTAFFFFIPVLPTECSYKPGRWRGEEAASESPSVSFSPRETGSDLILPANVVRARLHLPQSSSELLIGPSELIKR